MEALIELDHDFGEWFELHFVESNKSTIPVKEFKDMLGDLGSKVVKELKASGVVYKEVNRQRSLLINPQGTNKVFKNEVA